MVLKAYSKFTLSLKVYKKTKKEIKHRISGVFGLYEKIYDKIIIEPSKTNKDEINYFYKNKPLNMSNCNVKKTLNHLRNLFNIPFYKCTIYKNIPIGSGIGGSATDCASVIKYVLKKQNIPINKLNLKIIALNLGSDIPFFLSDYKWALVEGYGNIIKKINPQNIKPKIILTNIPCNSKVIYEKFDKSNTTKHQTNDLQEYALKNKSLMSFYKQLNVKFKNVMLSGSGGSFVVFDKKNMLNFTQ